MNLETLIYEKIEGVAKITINRPENYNSLNHTMSRELLQVAIECDEDNAVGSSQIKFRVDGSDQVTINSSGNVTATSFTGALTCNVTGNASGSSGSCTGNAATATAL